MILAKDASAELAGSSAKTRNLFLAFLQKEIRKNRKNILAANKKDLRNYDQSDSRYDRLLLNDGRIDAVIGSLEKIKSQPDPLGILMERRKLKNGLLLERKTVPLGLVCIIYESRPNVTIDSAALSIKSGNAVILKGGKESFLTNKAFMKCIQKALSLCDLPISAVMLLPPERETLNFVLQQDKYVDVVIPRGSQALIKFVKENSSIPTIETGAGVVHTYVDKSADIKMAAAIIVNEKTQRPGVCNALDFLLVHKAAAGSLFNELEKDARFKNIELHADPFSLRILEKNHVGGKLKKMTDADLGREYLSLTLGIKAVSGIREAIAHIQKYSSKHSESIITEDKANAELFLKSVDAACVYHNASTRFTDGEQFGFGGEIGISTQKLHARGPMGLPALTTYKWVIKGDGQIR